MSSMSDVDPRVVEVAGRRLFLKTSASCAAGLLCFGCTRAPAGQQRPPAGARAVPEKFAADAKMTFQEVYTFAYRGYISLLKALGDDIGRDKFLPMLEVAAARAAAEGMKKAAPPPPKNTLAAFIADMLDREYFWSHVTTLQWIEKTETAVEVRVTDCLWAATFRAAGAADIGYATTCHPDFAAAAAFNPKIRMVRTKTLMQGHDCCDHRWVVEA